MDPTLLIRADAGPRAGAGHVMRCLALAHGWQDFGGRAVLASRPLPDWIALRLATDGVQHEVINAKAGSAEDAGRLIQLAHQTVASWVVVDGYHLTDAYVDEVSSRVPRLALIDDLAQFERYSAELVVNQNLHAGEAHRASVRTAGRLLLGPRYALVRREFWHWADWQRPYRPIARRLLISVGGGDHRNVADRIAAAVTDLVPEITDIAILAGAPDSAALGTRQMLGADALVRRMTAADMAVAAAGSTVWELALMRLPAILLELAENQRRVARSLVEAGAVAASLPVEDVSETAVADAVATLARDSGWRRALASKARALVDGQGSRRVAQIMLGEPVRLREVTAADRRLLWLWANDPDVRRASMSTERISWRTHCAWFRDRMASEGCEMFVALDVSDAPVGQVRLDLAGERRARLSVSVAREHRSKGYGTRTIHLATERVMRQFPGIAVEAEVRASNTPSLRSFERAGFEPVGRIERGGALLITWRRGS